MGDVAGTGPELVARVLADAGTHAICRPLVVGDADILRRALRIVDAPIEVVGIGSPAEAPFGEDVVGCVEVASEARSVRPGVVDARAGRLAYDSLVTAIDLALAGSIEGITTAPLNKAALHAAGIEHPGHTEILAERCRVDSFAMMLYLPPGERPLGEPPQGEMLAAPHGLGVAHVTLHTSIASVPALVDEAAVLAKIDLVHEFLRRLGCDQPRIGVCALNPHAGEGGLFGDEEATHIAPAVRAALDRGLDATGPLPADTLMMRAVAGAFDGVVAMYHDQGHIALKLLDFHRAVNVTLGLPIVRTSASQGTAFDIAWQGLAQSDGMLEAVRVAARLASGDRS